ncbi:helix-turn-helix domain-containing protein [Amycolatopsis sp. lyj-23]|uniref:helix-turn-helix domain-containing protein n=1 Tax=Amycolatopsis sp. lyj-23 TaxID=2789283 RepID=UPI00397D3BD2
MVASSPTALKRWIAIELQRLRKAADVKPEDAAKRIGKAKTVIHHIETGRNLPAPADLEVLLNLYGVAERTPFFRELVKTAKRGTDWWKDFTDAVPEWFQLYLGLEAAAARISSYDAQIVPGLLQTPEYAEAVIRAGERRLPDHEVTRRVELRMARSAILTRDEQPPQLWTVLDESVLYRQVGGPAVLRAQLDHLVAMAELPNIDLQLLPADRGAHAGIEGTFTILDYPDEFAPDPGTAYVETRRRGIYYELPEDVRDYRDALDQLKLAATRPEDTAAEISRRAKEK